MTTALEGGEGSASRPGRSLPPGKTRYPLYSRLGRPQGSFGQVRKISPPTGSRSHTAQPVAQSLYRLSYPAHHVNTTSHQMPYALNYKRIIKFALNTGVINLQMCSPPILVYSRYGGFFPGDNAIVASIKHSSLVSKLRISGAIPLVREHAVAQLVEALRYKQEGRRFDSRWCHFNF